jgi:hypothetical protein
MSISLHENERKRKKEMPFIPHYDDDEDIQWCEEEEGGEKAFWVSSNLLPIIFFWALLLSEMEGKTSQLDTILCVTCDDVVMSMWGGDVEEMRWHYRVRFQ